MKIKLSTMTEVKSFIKANYPNATTGLTKVSESAPAFGEFTTYYHSDVPILQVNSSGGMSRTWGLLDYPAVTSKKTVLQIS